MFPNKAPNPKLANYAEHKAVVEEGLPSLLKAMKEAEITTPPRIAAFLTTIAVESDGFRYNVSQYNDTRLYRGRGFIQLTGSGNYGAAGKYFGIDLLRQPDLAASLEWSAPIAKWYWTVARRINPMADRLDMGAVNKAIGFPAGPGDAVRCEMFKNALQYLTGSVPDGINCAR